MKPGIYRGMSASEYHAIQAVSSSRLRKLDRSPAHARIAQAATDAMDFGQLLHVAVLEPDRFDQSFTVAGRCEARTKADKPCGNGGVVRIDGAWYCGVRSHAPDAQPDLVQAVAESDHTDCVRIRQAIADHPEASALLHGTERELSVVWMDEATGLLCKARLDAYRTGRIVDLKKTRDATAFWFTRDAERLGYHIQLAFYREGARRAGLHVDEAWIIAAEHPSPVYPVNAYRLTDPTLDYGTAEFRRLLTEWARCEFYRDWPVRSAQYPAEPLELSIPGPSRIEEWEEIAA